MIFDIEKITQIAKEKWEKQEVYKVNHKSDKPKFYGLEMFPYPSGAGLHVGHPLGYVAGDIFAKYKKMKGFNVLHPMGFDSFGLPTEQYAINTGISPQEATIKNIATYKSQFDLMGLGFDWSNSFNTTDPEYYKWTQWMFIQLFNSCYCQADDKAYPIEYLIKQFEKDGNLKTEAFCNDYKDKFSATEWKTFSEKEQSDILMNYRLAFISIGEVNWCEELGTVLANDEVINGKSERGGFPVVKKKMKQWSLRITAYSDRLLRNLNTIDFPKPLKEMQKNWIGKSKGAEVIFKTENNKKIDVFTTRPDTIFGCSFMVLAPEHPLVDSLSTENNKDAISAYIEKAKSLSNIDRQAKKEVSGQFTGSYAIHPFTDEKLPIYISDYVLMDYGTGSIMAVPAEDERDRKFAEKFNIKITEIYDKSGVSDAKPGDKKGILINSDFINGLSCKDGVETILQEIQNKNIGRATIQYKQRNANFSRQRYWGEPFPILWKNDIPYVVEEKDLPVVLPEVDEYQPTKDGKSPLARNQEWVNEVKGYTRETDTMPAFAGSAWYFLRYMDPSNTERFASEESLKYWNQVDLYIGGTEHAVGHLLYSRFVNMFLYDRGYIFHEEPYKKMINQGMIQGRTQWVYRFQEQENHFVSQDKLDATKEYTPLRVFTGLVEDDILDMEAFKNWIPEYNNATFEVNNDGNYLCGWEMEKMSKSKYNVVNPDEVIHKYGADTFRMFEMFLGPIEHSKPWNSSGIEGVSKFLNRFWGLYIDEEGNSKLSNRESSDDAKKILHKTIAKIENDIENFSFNTCVSTFMSCLNDLNNIKCDNSDILLPLLKALTPFAPHTTEAIWTSLGNENSIILEEYPGFEEKYLKDDSVEYPISVNGKVRAKITLPSDTSKEEAEKIALEDERIQKWIEGKEIRKLIFVPGRMINIVV